MALHSSAHPASHQAAPSPDISDPSDISRRTALAALPALGLASLSGAALLLPRAAHAQTPAGIRLQSWPLKAPSQTGIHDIAPAPDGGVWFSAQRSGHLGWLDPTTGKTELIALGKGSSPHGVIAGPDGAAWLTDGGQNAIVRVSWPARQVKVYPLPAGTPYANLNTCAFDGDGDLWFTGQSGYVGKVDVRTGSRHSQRIPTRPRPLRHLRHTQRRHLVVLTRRQLHRTPRPQDRHLKHRRTTHPTPRRPPSLVRQQRPHLGIRMEQRQPVDARPITGPGTNSWKTWKAPGNEPHVYAVYVDNKDIVWASEWSNNAMLRFDPASEKFDVIPLPRAAASVRQILGRAGEVWLPESGTEFVTVIRTG
jgi:virginiamycin B lyase